jgi:glycosyltransferase involved in cell wall biosynthesis
VTTTTRILFVVPCSPWWPSGVVRVEQYCAAMRSDGFAPAVVNYLSPAGYRIRRYAVSLGLRRSSRIPFATIGRLLDAARSFVAQVQIVRAALKREPIYVQWVAPPRWLVRFATRRTKLVYDFDDATYLAKPGRVDFIVRNAWKVVAGSHELFDYAISRNPAAVLIPSAVAIESYASGAKDVAGGHVPTIGWIGSESTLNQLAIAAPALTQLAERHDFQMLIVGTAGSREHRGGLRGVRTREIVQYTSEQIPALVRQFDVGIMPLSDDPWNRGKCAMKLLLYMAAGKPTVASRVGENRHVVEHGRSGFLANTTEEWIAALEQLLSDRHLALRFGARGREIVEERYSARSVYQTLKSEVLENFSSRG